MIIIGAKGHAKEILDLFENQNRIENLFFFDDYSKDLPKILFDKFKIIKTENEVKEIFKQDNKFALGLGGVLNRKILFEKFIKLGGNPFSVISNNTTIGSYNVFLGKGLNIMHNVSVFNDVTIGNGTLLNSFVSVHHDCEIGQFCEISPGARILGRVKIGKYTSIGSNAVILPDVVVGNNVTIGAGAVVTKNTDDNATYVGIPAKKIKTLPPFSE